MANYVDDFTAILSGYNLNGDANVSGKPVYLTYSFDEAPDAPAGSFESSSFLNSFSPFTSQEQSAATTALQEWGDASGITFLQVAPGEGSIRFGNYDFSKDSNHSGAAGFASYPGITIQNDYAFDYAPGSDVFISEDVKGYSANDMQHVIIHEIGHALGLKHSFEGNPILNPSFDNTDETVMSYNGYTPNIGPLDKDAVAYLYGPGYSDGSQDAFSYWNADTERLAQIGRSGDDVIVGVSTSDAMRGGTGNDFLYGGAGDDILTGGSGSDTLFGGSGSDRFVFNSSLGPDNIDKLQDFVSGQDVMVLRGRIFEGLPSGQLDDARFVRGPNAQSDVPSILYNSRTGALSYDEDGKGSAFVAQQFAQVQAGLQLSASDFRVV